MEYAEKLGELRRLLAKEDRDDGDNDALSELSDYVVENCDTHNALDRKTAEAVIDYRQRAALDGWGGYPIRCEKSFGADGTTYSVIAFGCSGENGGQDALDGIVFVREA